MQDVLACVACLWCVKCDLPCWYPLAALPDLSEELGKRSKQSSSLEVKFKNAQKLSQRLVLACQETIVGTVSTLKRLQVRCLSLGASHAVALSANADGWLGLLGLPRPSATVVRSGCARSRS